jgi:hypothetical protein
MCESHTRRQFVKKAGAAVSALGVRLSVTVDSAKEAFDGHDDPR